MRKELYRGTTSEAEQVERKEILTSAKPALSILQETLKFKLADKEIAQAAIKNYTDPNWAYLQADYIGSIRELKNLIDLLTIE